MTDRRRINPPSGGTAPPLFASSIHNTSSSKVQRPARTRQPDELRKIFLKTGLNPSASGSAYLELTPSSSNSTSPNQTTFTPSTSSLKLSVAVHGPHPLPRNAAFSPHLVLTTHIKFAPFATRHRRGYIRDAVERDLAVHLETALRGVILADRWPKSGVDVVVTVLEGEEDGWWVDNVGGGAGAGRENAVGGWGLMTMLAGCITASSAAVVDAGIDCVDLVVGGVAAVPGDGKSGVMIGEADGKDGSVLDPCPAEHQALKAACVVGYLASRDEVTEMWLKGNTTAEGTEALVDRAVQAAVMARTVLVEAVKESALMMLPEDEKAAEFSSKGKQKASNEVEMTG